MCSTQFDSLPKYSCSMKGTPRILERHITTCYISIVYPRSSYVTTDLRWVSSPAGIRPIGVNWFCSWTKAVTCDVMGKCCACLTWRANTLPYRYVITPCYSTLYLILFVLTCSSKGHKAVKPYIMLQVTRRAMRRGSRKVERKLSRWNQDIVQSLYIMTYWCFFHPVF